MKSRREKRFAVGLASMLFAGCLNGHPVDSETTYEADDDAFPSTAGSSDEVDAGMPAAPPPFSVPFGQLVPNEAMWGSFRVKLVAARVERGMQDAWNDGDERLIAPDVAYAEVDIEVTNTTVFDISLEWRNTWDLILSDGARVQQGNTIALALAPEATVRYTLRYEVEPDIDLSGSQLELNSVNRGVCAPERIPLDAPYAPDIDVSLVQLTGKAFESTRPYDFRRQRFDVVSAQASRNSSLGWRADYGKVYVELLVDVTIEISHTGGGNIMGNLFGIIVNGQVYAPINEINKLSSEGTTTRVPVVFMIDDTAKAFTVRFDVGWDPDAAPETEWVGTDVQL